MVICGAAKVPGDKSITHRALLLAGVAPGTSRIRGALTSLDARSTARVLRALGVGIPPLRSGVEILVHGRARLHRPVSRLDCGNSGTTARLLCGMLASHRFTADLTGDRSLRRRPMRRVTEPLARMGARFSGKDLDRLPLTIRGGALRSLRWELPVSSAQIKSALLFAGVVALWEPNGRSRDHTERMLRALGQRVRERHGWIEFEPDGGLKPLDLEIPGDPSSAAFLVGAALLAERGELLVLGVGVNPTRTGFLRVMSRMGGAVEILDQHQVGGEPVGDLLVRPATLAATEVVAEEIPGLIDEIPLLAALAARARGTSTFHQVGELRVKESDRLALLARNLQAVGCRAVAEGNSLLVEGSQAPPRGRVQTEGDHRIAMAFAVLGTLPGARVEIDDLICAAVSFPGFEGTLAALGGRRGDR